MRVLQETKPTWKKGRLRDNPEEERDWPGIMGRSGFEVYVKGMVKGYMAFSGPRR